MQSHREPTLDQIQHRLDALADQRREKGLTEAERQEYAELVTAEAALLRLRNEA